MKWLWIVVVIAAAVLYFARNFSSVSNYFNQLDPLRLLLSLVLMLIAKSLFAVISRYSVQAEDWQPSYLQMFSIYALTQLAKYIPGGVWHYVGRFGMYRSRDMSNARAGKAMVLENMWLVGSALGVGFTLLLVFKHTILSFILPAQFSQEWWIPAGAAVFLLWLAGMVVVRDFFSSSTQHRFTQPLAASGILAAAWFLVGISFALLAQPGAEIDLSLSVGGFSISWAVGFLTLFAPGGLGIREVLLSMFFASSLPPNLAPVLAGAHRLVWVASEILLGVFFSLPAVDRHIQHSPTGSKIDEH